MDLQNSPPVLESKSVSENWNEGMSAAIKK